VGDLQFHFFGYFLCFVNCIFTGSVMITSKTTRQATGLGEVSLLVLPNLFSVLPMFALSYVLGEFDALASWPRIYLRSPGFWV